MSTLLGVGHPQRLGLEKSQRTLRRLRGLWIILLQRRRVAPVVKAGLPLPSRMLSQETSLRPRVLGRWQSSVLGLSCGGFCGSRCPVD
jgi:hypothetical protein